MDDDALVIALVDEVDGPLRQRVQQAARVSRSRSSCSRSDPVSEFGPASRIVIVGGSIAATAARELRAGGFQVALRWWTSTPSPPPPA